MSETYRLQKIDELLLPSHQYLAEDDECFFFMTYTRLDQGFTPENDLIMNFKKGMDKQGRNEWKWKGFAIARISELFINNIPPLKKPAIFVPIPPSNAKNDPMYDDRIVQVVNNFCNARENAECREIILANANVIPTHKEKKSPDELLPFLTVDKALCQDQVRNILIVDDVITEGAHFKACQTLLKAEFPNSKIKGLFIARTEH